MDKVQVRGGAFIGPVMPDQGLAEQFSRLNAANLELTRQIADLSLRNNEMALLGRMNAALQVSLTEAESYPVISDALSQLFPADSGAVFMRRIPHNVFEAATKWGGWSPPERTFPCGNCRAYQCGKMFVASSPDQGCADMAGDQPWHACLPLLAADQLLGVLHLRNRCSDDGFVAETRTADDLQLAQRLADDIALGIWGIRSRESLRDLSIRDPLTGLFNRRYMDEALAHEQRRTMRHKAQLAVIMIDIDDFRRFNDSFGHDAGDAVLQSLGDVFRRNARGSDVACRYGGEEFVLILSPSSADGARRLAERIRQEVRHLAVTHAGRKLGVITLSLGVAMFPEQASDPAALIKAADIALYEAKNSGRDRVVMYDRKVRAG